MAVPSCAPIKKAVNPLLEKFIGRTATTPLTECLCGSVPFATHGRPNYASCHRTMSPVWGWMGDKEIITTLSLEVPGYGYL
jgi:hypothetical protein